MLEYETYARNTEQLHPRCQRILAPFFAQSLLDRVTIRIVDPPAGPFAESLGWRGAVVLFQTIFVLPGMLDADTTLRGVTWSWSRPIGIANWAHEVLHCQQWHSYPVRFALQYLTGAVLSWKRGKWYVHNYFPYEQEALAFEQRVRQYYEEHPIPLRSF